MEETGTGATTTPMARTGATSRTRCTAGGRHRPPPSSLRVTAPPPMAGARVVEATLSRAEEVTLSRATPLSQTLPTSRPRLLSSTSPPTLLSSTSQPTLLSNISPPILQATLLQHQRTAMGVTRAPVDGKMSSMFQPSVMNSSPHRPPRRARSSSVP